MKHFSFFLSISALLLSMSCAEPILTGDLVITNVNVIDVENGATIAGQTVAVKNGEIISIQLASDAHRIEANYLVDGNNKYLIPALWDMHTHYTTSRKHKGFLNLFVANGVLGVRDLWGDLESRDSLMNSNVVAPEIFLSGAIIDGPFTLLQGTLQPTSAEEVVKIVDSLHQKGADFIKVYDDLSEEIYNVIANRCNELKLPFAGHVPLSIATENASKIGQKSMEHLNGIWQSSTTKETEIDSLQQLFKNNFLNGNMPGAIMTFTTINTYYNNFYDEQKAIELAKVLSENGTYVTPTLTIISNHWRRRDASFKELSENKYVPDDMLNQWDPELNFPEKMFPQPTWESGIQLLRTSMNIVRTLNDNGVNILAGTDCGVSYVIPGFSLHDELEFLVEAGLSEAEALQSATINPAKYFELSENHGTIKQNMIANMVLLNANPLDDITNTQNIIGVIQNGTYLDREMLDLLLKEAEIQK